MHGNGSHGGGGGGGVGTTARKRRPGSGSKLKRCASLPAQKKKDDKFVVASNLNSQLPHDSSVESLGMCNCSFLY